MPRTEHRSYCRFCVALCGVIVTTEGDRVVEVRGDPDHPQSQGYTCPKGRSLGAWHHHPDRLDHPELGRPADGRARAPWDEVLDDLAARLEAIVATAGPDAVGTYLATGASFDAAGRRLTSKLVRSLGSRSVYSSGTVDAPSKPYVAELVAGHPALAPAVDLERTRLTLLVGSNPVVSHGHLQGFPNPRTRLRRLATDGELWVIDPRRTETARLATGHLAVRPGTDHVLLAALVRARLAAADPDDLARRATGVEALTAAVAPFTLEVAAARCGVDRAQIEALLAALERHGRFAGQTGTGVTMSAGASVTEWLLWALHVVQDAFDQPGGAWFNPGFLRSLDRQRVSPGDGRPAPGPASRPELPGRNGELPSAALADEIEAGNLRALIVLGGNPVTAFPEPDRVAAALGSLEVLAVCDVVPTATTALATHLLPVAGQLERADLPHLTDGYQSAVATQYTPAVVPPAAERRPAWWVAAHLGERLGVPLLPAGLAPDDATDDDVLAPLTARSRADLDTLRTAGPVVAADAVYGWVTAGVLPEGRWRIAPAPLLAQLAALEDDRPAAGATAGVDGGAAGGADRAPALALIPHRRLRHLNSQLAGEATSDGRSDPAELRLHPDDVAVRGLTPGATVRVHTATGGLTAVLRADPDLRPGVVAVPHGFARCNVNHLTSLSDDVDPLTGMVRLSGVRVEVVAAPGTGPDTGPPAAPPGAA